jgi:hypothetical protein
VVDVRGRTRTHNRLQLVPDALAKEHCHRWEQTKSGAAERDRKTQKVAERMAAFQFRPFRKVSERPRPIKGQPADGQYRDGSGIGRSDPGRGVEKERRGARA